MSGQRSVAAYRCLLMLYPRPFRDEYGPDMTQLLVDQMQEEPAVRVWLRCVADLAMTVPARHLEAHMKHPPHAAVPLFFISVSAAAALFAIIVGPNSGTFAAVGLAFAAIAGALALATGRNVRGVATSNRATTHWWKWLAGGGSILAGIIIVTSITGELGNPEWLVMVIALVSALLAIAAGFTLGVVHLTGAHHRNASS